MQDKTRQDQTRQDLTRQDSRRLWSQCTCIMNDTLCRIVPFMCTILFTTTYQLIVWRVWVYAFMYDVVLPCPPFCPAQSVFAKHMPTLCRVRDDVRSHMIFLSAWSWAILWHQTNGLSQSSENCRLKHWVVLCVFFNVNHTSWLSVAQDVF